MVWWYDKIFYFNHTLNFLISKKGYKHLTFSHIQWLLAGRGG